MSSLTKSISECSNVVVISQPMYFPWIGFLSQLSMANTIIWLDDVQFSKGSFVNRIQIKNKNKINWLTCNLEGKGTNQIINQLKLHNISVVDEQRNQLNNCFKYSPHQTDSINVFDETWAEHTSLSETIIKSTQVLCKSIGLKLPIQYRSSALNTPGKGSQRVQELVRLVEGDAYLTGHGASRYLDHYSFEKEKITVHYMCYENFNWQQIGNPFTPFVTSLDLVANVAARQRINHLVKKSCYWREFL